MSFQTWGIFFSPFFHSNIFSFNFKSQEIIVAAIFFPKPSSFDVHLHSLLCFKALQKPGRASGCGWRGWVPTMHSFAPGKGILLPSCKHTRRATDQCLHDTTRPPAANHPLAEAKHDGFRAFPQGRRTQQPVQLLSPITLHCWGAGCGCTSAPACISPPKIRKHRSQLCALYHCPSLGHPNTSTFTLSILSLLGLHTESEWDAEHKYYTCVKEDKLRFIEE